MVRLERRPAVAPRRRRARPSPGPPRWERLRSDLGHVGRLLALGAGHQVELHALALAERAKAARANGREVDEHILAGVRRDEAEALGVVEPLDRALHATFRGARLHGGAGRSRATRPPPAAVAAAVAATVTAGVRATASRAVETVAAQHRPAGRGHERHLGVATALRARRGIHRLLRPPVRCRARACARRRASRLALLATVLAARGFVREPALAVKRLLTGGEQELLAAIHTGDALVLRARHDSGAPPERDGIRDRLKRGRPRHECPGG